MKGFKPGLLPVSAAIMLAGLCQQAAASGFAIIEHSASGMGNAFAGAAAVANDATTAWFNPAGLMLIKGAQLTVSGHIIDPSADYTDKGSSVNPALTGGTVAPGSITGRNDDGGSLAFVPNLYYVRPLNEKMNFGLAINAPFGLETDYSDRWVGRYHALNSEIKTVNINPSLGWKISDQLSVGVGVSAQYVQAKLSQAIDSAAFCLSAAGSNPALLSACGAAGLGVGQQSTQALDSKVELDADDWSFGFNLGLMYAFNDATRLGASYRSGITQDAEGDANFKVNAALAPILGQVNAGLAAAGANQQLLVDTGIAATVELPDSFSLSLAHQATSKLQLLGDITWTGWSSFKELRIKFDSGQPDGVTEEAWDDVLRYSIGANYVLDDKWTLRIGLAYDEEAIPDTKHRTPRIPGNDRTWLSFGTGLNVSEKIHLDFGYAHLFVDDTPADHTDGNGYTLRGVYEADVNIYSAQLNWNF